ncbi:MAG: hypothetical protein KDI88_11075 [Gammaproteobacteria bacterium]|nr:hypothetical protein [Gammaproteobacteria bacterium]
MQALGNCHRLIGTCCVVIASVVGADPITWTGEDEPTAFFDLGGNWEPSGAPGSDDTAIVPEDAVVSPILRNSQTIGILQAPGGLRLNAILTVVQPSSVSGLIPWGAGTKRVRTTQAFTFGGDNNLKPIVLEGEGTLGLGKFIHDGGTTIGSASMTAPFVNRGGILKLDGAPSFTELTNEDRLELTRTRVTQGLIENTATVTYAHDPGLNGGGSLDDFKQTAGVLKGSSGELEITGDVQHYDGGEIEVADGADLRIVGSALNGPSSSDQRFGGLRVARGDGTLEVSGLFQVTQDVEMSLSGDGVDSVGLIVGGLDFLNGSRVTNLGLAHFDPGTRLRGTGEFKNDSGGRVAITGGDLDAVVINANGGLIEAKGDFYIGDPGVHNESGADWKFLESVTLGAVPGATTMALRNTGSVIVDIPSMGNSSVEEVRLQVPLTQTAGYTWVRQGKLRLQAGGGLAGLVQVGSDQTEARFSLEGSDYDIRPGFTSECFYFSTFAIGGSETDNPVVRVLSDWTMTGPGYHEMLGGELLLVDGSVIGNSGRLALYSGRIDNNNGEGGIINDGRLIFTSPIIDVAVLNEGGLEFHGMTTALEDGVFINSKGAEASFYDGADLTMIGDANSPEGIGFENRGVINIHADSDITDLSIRLSNKGVIEVMDHGTLRLSDLAELDNDGLLRDGGQFFVGPQAYLVFPRNVVYIDGSTVISADQSDQLISLTGLQGKSDAERAKLLTNGVQQFSGELRVGEFGTLGGSGTVQGPGFRALGGTVSGTLTLDTDQVDTDGATIAPGNSTGTLVVTGNLSSVNTVFDMELVDATTEDYDRIDIGGDMSLNGDTIQLSVLDDAEIDEGDAFDLFRAQSITGAETVNLAVPPGLVVSREVVAQGGREVLRLTIADIGPEFEPRRRQNASTLSIINLLLDDE